MTPPSNTYRQNKSLRTVKPENHATIFQPKNDNQILKSRHL